MLPESRFPKLISLLDKGQRVQPDILGAAIRIEFENIDKARQLRISWDEIAEALGFPGKGKLASASYSRERRRREKKGGVKLSVSQPQKTENGKQKNEVSAGTRTIQKQENGITTGVPLIDEAKSGNLFDQRRLF